MSGLLRLDLDGLVIGEGRTWRALWKPPGVTVFPDRRGESPSLCEALAAVGGDGWPEGFEQGLLHRLDRWTSGLVLAARNPADVPSLRVWFAEHRLTKHYLLRSDGEVPWSTHRVDRAMAHHPRDARKMVWQRGRSTPHRGPWLPAVTELRRCGPLWHARMRTGVMHQIRVHAASVGLPLRGDRLYGGAADPIGRFWLHHAAIVGWPDPLPEAPLPDDWPTGSEAVRWDAWT